MRPPSTPIRAMARDRNRSMSPFLEVVGQPDAGAHGAERDGLGEDPGHQVVDVPQPEDLADLLRVTERLRS